MTTQTLVLFCGRSLRH